MRFLAVVVVAMLGFPLGGCENTEDGASTARGELHSAKSERRERRRNRRQRASKAKTPSPSTPSPRLVPEQARETAPPEFAVEIDTTKGRFIIAVHRAWAPLAADRFFNLVKLGYYDNSAFFRVIDGFVAQAGIHGDPAVSAAWRSAYLEDDPPAGHHNLRGTVAFAANGPQSRSTQFFINLADNSRLDGLGFVPFGEVREMSVVDSLFSGYGDVIPIGTGPSQDQLHTLGDEYLRQSFPSLDRIERAAIQDPNPGATAPAPNGPRASRR